MSSEAPFSKKIRVTDEVKESFDKEGFFILRSLFSKEEVAKLLSFFNSSEEIQKYAFGQEDGAKRKTKVCLWKYVGDDVGDMASRSRRVVDTFEQLLGGEELYHYHSKLMMKEAETGGQHVWHQDYGYWYENGCLTPDMGSVFIALDPSVKANGCLQVLAGSHKMGRVDTQLIGEGAVTQRGANLARVEMARSRYRDVFVELQPGDTVFFHSNLLHTSAQNHSTMRRYSMIIAYNQRINNPMKEHHHASYNPLVKVEDSALMECTTLKSTIEKTYFKPEEDMSIKQSG